ncbi:MAG: hypothetical protein ABWX90_03595 [Candidatus Saccharimonadales bacterium]
MTKVIIATQKNAATAAAKKPVKKKVKVASNIFVGAMRGLHKDFAEAFEDLENTVDALGVNADDLEGAVEHATFSQEGAKGINTQIRHTIKDMKNAVREVRKVETSLSYLMRAVQKGVHPDHVATDEDQSNEE